VNRIQRLVAEKPIRVRWIQINLLQLAENEINICGSRTTTHDVE